MEILASDDSCAIPSYNFVHHVIQLFKIVNLVTAPIQFLFTYSPILIEKVHKKENILRNGKNEKQKKKNI